MSLKEFRIEAKAPGLYTLKEEVIDESVVHRLKNHVLENPIRWETVELQYPTIILRPIIVRKVAAVVEHDQEVAFQRSSRVSKRGARNPRGRLT